jgi:hypothetical protein
MYERFTDRARKVMQLANQEAMRFNHEYIGTEHILLGLVKEGSGVAANVLKNLDVDLRTIRREVEKIVQYGPDMVTMGKLPQTPRARKVIERAIEEARNLNHNYVGTEHLLLGLLGDGDCAAGQVLLSLGLRLEEVRRAVQMLLGSHFSLRPPNRGKREEVRREEVRVMPGQESAEPRDEPGGGRDARPCRGQNPLETSPREVSGIPVPDERQRRAESLLDEQRARIDSLERQLWNVRLLFGALVGVSAGALLAGQTGALLGLLIGGALAVLGRALPAAAAAGAAGALLGPIHLASEGGAVAGGLLGALLAVCVVEVGRSRKRNPGAGANPPLLATCCLGRFARRRRCGRGSPPAGEAEGQGRA